jgi:heat shock protein HslJ
MKSNFIATTFIAFFILVIAISCTNQTTNIEKKIIGKWNIVGIMFNNKEVKKIQKENLYAIEFTSNSSCFVKAEDNQLSGSYTLQDPNLLLLKETSITDVCCNTKLADSVFNFFREVNYLYNLKNDTLQINSNNNLLI